ncbi:MAG TPA: HAMP domain-containing sensor histidine kinase [Rubrobacter sp.]|nr:HAMP domain-containing sensor histidine kinase [Rubrobacter sp.]
MPIRWRLTLFIALVMGMILLALSLTLYLLNRNALLKGVKESAENGAITVADTIEAGDTLSSAADDDDQLILDEVGVIIRDKDGVILQSKGLQAVSSADDNVWRKALKQKKVARGEAVLAGDNDYYVVALPVDAPNSPSQVIDEARVVESLKSYDEAEESLETFVTLLATSIGAAFLLSIGSSYLLAGATLRPVDTVTSAASKMGEGDLSKRLPVANPKDELGRLVITINALLSRLEAAFVRREEALERQRRFAADASHELRTPLTSISGHARMLDEWALEGDKETARRSVGTIRKETGRMRGLIGSLLTLTRGDEGAPMEVGRYDLGAVGKEATETAGAAADGRVSVGFVPIEHQVTATFDRERVMQVASILLDNAVKYTPEGGNVTVRVVEENGGVALAVSDTGVGISEDQLPLIFERFYRADPSRSDGGAGLGLSIARQIAESHGGQIRVESTPGTGSTFTLLLPKRSRPPTPERLKELAPSKRTVP